jgi:hypothetical protein
MMERIERSSGGKVTLCLKIRMMPKKEREEDEGEILLRTGWDNSS